MKILVTGANGFIGRQLCRYLIKQGHQVFGLDHVEGEKQGFAGFFVQDIGSPFTLPQEFDFIFHLAAYNVTHVGDQDSDLYQWINVQGTKHVLQAAKAGAFIFFSSYKVYKPQGKPIRETSPVAPVSLYEKSKLAAEDLCRKIFKGKKLSILRPVNIVGPGQSEKAVIPVLFKKAKHNEPLEIFGPRSSVLQILSVSDVVEALALIIQKGGVNGTFNLSTKEHITLEQLALTIKEISKSKSEIRFTNDDASPFSEVLGGKLEKALGWKAKTGIREILDGYSKGTL